jgi:hypothetical protein
MERLYQGHLHPLLKQLETVIFRASAVGGEHSSKQLFEQSVNSFSEHLHELASNKYTPSCTSLLLLMLTQTVQQY